MIVSLEAIFLSTFVMISQNRADAKRQAIADQQWQTVKEEDRQNEELLELSRQILDLNEGDSRRPPPASRRPRLGRASGARVGQRHWCSRRTRAVAAVWHRRRAASWRRLTTTERR